MPKSKKRSKSFFDQMSEIHADAAKAGFLGTKAQAAAKKASQTKSSPKSRRRIK